MTMEWQELFEGMKVVRITGRNKGRKGLVAKIFSVSGTIHVRYDDGSMGKFVNPAHFKKL